MSSIKSEQVAHFIQETLAEDVGDGDYTSLACIPSEKRDVAELIMKETGMIAGIEIAKAFLKQVDPDARIEVDKEDGTQVYPGERIFTVDCNTRALLQAERSMLNTLQRMSGIATNSGRFADEVSDLPVEILDTRKTTPRMRFLDKWAVRIGGCSNYRFGLYDRFLIKDNHIDACGSITDAIRRVNQYKEENDLDLEVTIEVRNLVETHEVLDSGGIDRIMFDNFELPILNEAVAVVNGAFETEASGGIHLNNVRSYAKTGVDYVSAGALTHSAGTLDMSLVIQ